MPWICPYCGHENFQDERVGRRDPRCRICNEERITPEDLEKLKVKTISQLSKDYKELQSTAEGILESMEFHQSIIEEHAGPLADLKEELEEVRSEAIPIRVEIDRWEGMGVHYGPRDRAFHAEQDKYQTKLPFEVPA